MKKLCSSLATLLAVAVPVQANNLQGPLSDFSKALDLLGQAVQRSAVAAGSTQTKGRPFSAAELQARSTKLKPVEPSEGSTTGKGSKPSAKELKAQMESLKKIEPTERPEIPGSVHLKGIQKEGSKPRGLLNIELKEKERATKEEQLRREQRQILLDQIMRDLTSAYKITPEDLEILEEKNFIPEETLDALAKKLATLSEKDRKNFYGTKLPELRERVLDRKVENLHLTPDELYELRQKGIIKAATTQALLDKLSTIGSGSRDEFFKNIKEARKPSPKKQSYWEKFMDEFYKKFPGLEE